MTKRGQLKRHPWLAPLGIVVGALLLQLPLYGFMFETMSGSGFGYGCDKATIGLLERQILPLPGELDLAGYKRRCGLGLAPPGVIHAKLMKIEDKKPDELEELPEDAQIVDVPDQPEPEKVEPKETKFVSNKTTRTKKETRSRRVAPPSKTAGGNADVKQPSPVQSDASKSPDPTVTTKNKPQPELQLADATTKLPDGDRGRPRSDSIIKKGKDTRILLPPTSDAATLANLQAMSGEYATNDYLPDLDLDKSTVLNANRYKYADFFLRVKRAVEKQWHPAQLYRRRDPTGRAYGVKDRYTLLRVTLDDEGRVTRLLTTRDSGLEFLDDEAKMAFKRAEPFPNPPDGLLTTKNEVVFEFGFYFEITGGRRKFRWRRL